jgi:hypothetical protein
VLPANGNAVPAVVYRARSDVMVKMIVVIIATRRDARTSRVLRRNFYAITTAVYRPRGNAIRKMIAAMVLTKAIFAPKKLVHISR